jgi:hypothetical protein
MEFTNFPSLVPRPRNLSYDSVVCCLNQQRSYFPFTSVCDRILTWSSHGCFRLSRHRNAMLSMLVFPHLSTLTGYSFKYENYFETRIRKKLKNAILAYCKAMCQHLATEIEENQNLSLKAVVCPAKLNSRYFLYTNRACHCNTNVAPTVSYVSGPLIFELHRKKIFGTCAHVPFLYRR